MSEEATIKVRPQRYRVRKTEPQEVHRYLDVSGRVTLGEVLDVIAEASDVVPSLDQITISGTFVWSEPATKEDLDRWAEADREFKERVEAGERRAYERLKAKYG